MNKILIVIVVLLVVLIAVVLYNMYQENQYRKKIRSQFGHADQDALMDSQTVSVRDGKNFGSSDAAVAPLRRAPVSPLENAPLFQQKTTAAPSQPPQPEPAAAETENPIHLNRLADTPPSEKPAPQPAAQTEAQPYTAPIEEQETAIELTLPAEPAFSGSLKKAADKETKTAAAKNSHQNELLFDNMVETAAPPRRFCIEPEALAQLNLAWFDKRFDYTACVALPEAQELRSIPRFSGRQRFQIVGNTLDGRFQAAEPIPGVKYQAFVIGLQAISRNGLADEQDLREFEQQVERFAAQLNGSAEFADRHAFLAQARELDEMCARVDQTIAIHLVSRRNTISGTELRTALELHGFVLQNEGSFAATAADGSPTFAVVPLDGSGFTEALLASQPYKGFSMLFDITRVDGGENRFNDFMNLAVALSGGLELELVDDQIQPLSTEWLKEVRSYVGARQQEMVAAGVIPGSPLAKRLFS